MADLEESLEDALLFALDDLREDNFMRFKNKLGFLRMEGKARVPQGKLEGATTMETVQLLLAHYGKEGAWEVAVHVLKEVNLRDSATKLQKWKRNDCQRNYKRHLQETFWPMPEPGSDCGSRVGLPQRYTELLLLSNPQPSKKTHEFVVAEKKHRKMEAEPAGERSQVVMENLFESAAGGTGPRTVVLYGPAGVGKTTAMRKLMLDWASGQFWRTNFEYAFYLSCRALNLGSAKALSLVDLLLSGCPPGTLLAEDILAHQDRLLLVLDGFDELRPGDLRGDGQSAGNPQGEQPASSLVTGLLRKKLLPPCHLLVTTRPAALASLLRCLRSPQLVEMLGFRPAQREEYFHRFFEDEEEAARAFEPVRRNETLWGMCLLPAACWVICSVLSGRLERETLRDIPQLATITDAHMGLLLGFLGCPPRLMDLKGLCSLAKDGVLRQTMVYDEEQLRARGLEPCPASRRLLHQEVHPPGTCRFVHLAFQEFLAALFYLLDSDKEATASSQDLGEVFGNKECHCRYGMLVRFLFGLSNPERQSILQERWGCRITSGARLRQEFLRWVEQEAKRPAFPSGDQVLELCHCLYEMQDSQFSRSVMGHVLNLDLRGHLSTKLDLAALSFCLSATGSLCSLQLSGYQLGPTELRQLSPGLLKSPEIQLNRCGLTAATGRELVCMVMDNQDLTHLDLGENPLDDSGVTHLCERFMDSNGKLQNLRLPNCGLTAASCKALAGLLPSKEHHLTELDLGENCLGDEGVRSLCESLKHPQSKLQRLTLHRCGLTAASCKELASVLEASESLQSLGLGDNSLGDEGVRQLCLVLKKPYCKLRSLSLSLGPLNRNTRRKLEAVQNAHPLFSLTSYYPPGFPVFPGADE